MSSKSLENIRNSGTPLELDKPRTLKFDLNALAELEDHYGNVNAAFGALQSGSFKAARFLLWAGLVHEDEALTEREAGALITMENIEEVFDKIAIAMSGDISEPEDIPEPMNGMEPDPT